MIRMARGQRGVKGGVVDAVLTAEADMIYSGPENSFAQREPRAEKNGGSNVGLDLFVLAKTGMGG
jgi:hypothetical protein